jgi:hypothetical protein
LSEVTGRTPYGVVPMRNAGTGPRGMVLAATYSRPLSIWSAWNTGSIICDRK